MFAFPAMLVGAAERAGMKVPPDPDEHEAVKDGRKEATRMSLVRIKCVR